MCGKLPAKHDAESKRRFAPRLGLGIALLVISICGDRAYAADYAANADAGQMHSSPIASSVEAIPLPASPSDRSAVTLDQAIAATLTADPKICAGLEAIRQANADLLTSSLPPNPTLITGGVYLPFRQITPDNPGGPTELDVQVGYPIDWFLFGSVRRPWPAPIGACTNPRPSTRTSFASASTTTATAFYDVLEAKSLVELTRQDTDNLSQLQVATREGGRRRWPAGGGVQSRSFGPAQESTGPARSGVDSDHRQGQIRAQMGRTDRDPAFDVDGNLDAPLTTEPLPVDEAVAIARQNRPDIQSLRVQVSKAEADTVVERRKAYPQISPQFGYAHQYQIPTGSPDFDSWNVSLTATLPLFDRNQGDRAKAQSVVDAELLQLAGWAGRSSRARSRRRCRTIAPLTKRPVRWPRSRCDWRRRSATASRRPMTPAAAP